MTIKENICIISTLQLVFIHLFLAGCRGHTGPQGAEGPAGCTLTKHSIEYDSCQSGASVNCGFVPLFADFTFINGLCTAFTLPENSFGLSIDSIDLSGSTNLFLSSVYLTTAPSITPQSFYLAAVYLCSATGVQPNTGTGIATLSYYTCS